MADSESLVTSPVTKSCMPRQKYLVELSSGIATKLNSLEKLSLDMVILYLSPVRGRWDPSFNHWILDGAGKPENVHKKLDMSPTTRVVSLGSVVILIGTFSDGDQREGEGNEVEREGVRRRNKAKNEYMKYSTD